MRILLAGEFRHAWYEAAWARALRELGHDVCEVRLAAEEPSFSNRVQQRLAAGPLLRRLNRALVDRALDLRPDVVLAYRALMLLPDTIARLRERLDARWVCYQNDNIFGPLAGKAYWRQFRAAIPHFDLHLAFRESDVPRFREAGARNVRMLRAHFLPWLHRPLGRARSVEIGFYGHCEPDRRLEWLDGLMRAVPAKYSVRGSAWDRYGGGRAWQGLEHGEIQNERYVEAIGETKIALSFFSALNQDTYTSRVFEIPACGTFMLCQRTPDMLTLYEEGKETAFFGSTEELVEQARRHLRDDAARERIAEAGRRRVHASGYDIHSRMKEWLAAVREI